MKERLRLDAEAKATLRKLWPKRTEVFGAAGGRRWLRCQPVDGKSTHPRIRPLGSRLFATQPDGLYAQLAENAEYADIVAFEVCSSFQNLFDKRSRYAATTSSVGLDLPLGWLTANAGKKQKWWQASKSFAKEPDQDLMAPIRHSRVVFVLPPDHYVDWFRNASAQGHEFYMPTTSLKSFTSAKMQEFLARMRPQANFYTGNLELIGAKGKNAKEIDILLEDGNLLELEGDQE